VDENRNGEMESRIARLEAQLRSSERRESIETAFWAVMHNVFPQETRKHMKAAGREQLLAARSYLDHWIARMDEAPAKAAAERETIEVE